VGKKEITKTFYSALAKWTQGLMLTLVLLLGIETSCDETSVAVVRDGRDVLSCIISSSKHDFETVGGVIPEEAARKQLEVILPVLEKALHDASVSPQDLDGIAVTSGPGLLGSLLVGTTAARTLSAVWGKPLIPVHHTLGHLSSVWLKEVKSEKGKVKKDVTDSPSFPILTLSVSGGHTDLWCRTKHTKGSLIGSTIDDAAGEAFDKGAVQLGLGYPGGPALSRFAESGDPAVYEFPTPLHGDSSINFSFSGLKTSLKYLLRDLGEKARNPTCLQNLAAGYELAICKHLIEKLEVALLRFNDVKEIHIVGGVSANRTLRERAGMLSSQHNVVVRFPKTLRFCTDNGAMIASAGYFLVQEKPEMLHAQMKTSSTARLEDVLGG